MNHIHIISLHDALPILIRLNPNIPWKTRGNGAVCLRIMTKAKNNENIIDFIKNELEKNSEIGKGANPGLRSEEHTLNSSHLVNSYAVFCLKKREIGRAQ